MTKYLLTLTSIFVIINGLLPLKQGYAHSPYPWLSYNQNTTASHETLIERITPPPGFERVKVRSNSFAKWLRRLPMKAKNTPVRYYNGQLKYNQNAHTDVIHIDVGTRDLQQCADAVMRLRAEYLYAIKNYDKIAFNFTNGKRVKFSKWSKRRGLNYKNFRKYMTLIFAYAGTYSLAKELTPRSVKNMQIGDVFIKGGFPGHAVLVVDMVVRPKTGEKRFLLLQSYMPAQDMHVLRNPKAGNSPWYSLNFGDRLITPEWTFKSSHLKHF